MFRVTHHLGMTSVVDHGLKIKETNIQIEQAMIVVTSVVQQNVSNVSLITQRSKLNFVLCMYCLFLDDVSCIRCMTTYYCEKW